MTRRVVPTALILVFLLGLRTWAGSIDEVTFVKKIQTYETVVDTTIVTQEGKRIKVTKGTRLNVAGFTSTEAFVVSRKDRPTGFVKREDIVPAKP